MRGKCAGGQFVAQPLSARWARGTPQRAAAGAATQAWRRQGRRVVAHRVAQQARGRYPLDGAQRGGQNRHLEKFGRALFRPVWSAATPFEELQAVDRSVLRRKVRDVVGLYLNPPDKAVVLCVDEKSQIQALERTQPILPLGLGYAEGVTHDYFRHGTVTLFAALDIVTGGVISQCKPRHRHQEFLSFLKHLDGNTPAAMELHLIADNYATHKHPRVKAWLARHPRFHLHFTPTYSSWLNQVERWFGLITQQAIRRGSFRNVRQLVDKIEQYVTHYNEHRRPFVWTATADSILAKVERICKLINGT